jgi:AcrR family transcriptional regulator
MADQKRPYHKQRRADSEQDTRRRLTESAVALHGTLGPSRTTMSAVAAHAGVRRSTLYRHFPDEAALFVACTAHWTAANPLPDLERWTVIVDPETRLREGLSQLYAYYETTERMVGHVLRDAETMPIVARMLGGFLDYMAAAREALMAGRHDRGAGGRRVRAAIGHAVAFSTWRSLVREQGLDTARAVELMCRLVASAAPPAKDGSAAPR